VRFILSLSQFFHFVWIKRLIPGSLKFLPLLDYSRGKLFFSSYIFIFQQLEISSDLVDDELELNYLIETT
jgi:hypothetical protein